MQPLNPKAFGLALGSTFALGMILLAVISMIHGSFGNTVISILSSAYLGYDNTIPGALFGGIWGFVDGGIMGFVIAWIYNKVKEL
ncbi:MAG TPA: bacteriophage holin [Candidatus Peribacterales bacterium]|nr:bacteriophage holin [Candidatus Peribacterales bacterium]